MTKPRFDVRILGSGVLPETVGAGELADFLIELEKAVRSMLQSRAAGETEEAVISLVDVAAGSNRLTIAVAPAAVWAVSAITQAVASSDYRQLPYDAHLALAQLSGKAVTKQWSIEFARNSKLDLPRAVISAEHTVPDPPPYPTSTKRFFRP